MIIVIEGCDQAGKQTQAGLLAGALNRKGRKARVFAFPDYTTPVGKMMKKQLGGRGFEPRVFHCLAAANRWEKAGEIRAASSGGSVAILDRYRQSNIVYGALNGLSKRWLAGLDAGLPRADMVILLDIKQKEAFRRKPSGRDRLERDASFSNRVAAEYRRAAKTGRWKIVDASGTKDQVHGRVMRLAGAYL